METSIPIPHETFTKASTCPSVPLASVAIHDTLIDKGKSKLALKKNDSICVNLLTITLNSRIVVHFTSYNNSMKILIALKMFKLGFFTWLLIVCVCACTRGRERNSL